MTVSLGTAYRSFDGEVEASNTPTICRLHRFMPSPTFGHSSRDIVQIVNAVAEKGLRVRPNRVLALVKSIYRWGVSEDLIVIDPTQGIRRRVKERARDRVLSTDEIRHLWSALDQAPMSKSVVTAIRLALVTAARIGEVSCISKSELDLTPGKEIWTLPAQRSKNKEPHTLPLSRLAVVLIEAAVREAAGSDFLFPSPSKDMPIDAHAATRAMSRARAGLGIENIRLHDLRRSASTHMASLGVAPHVIERILNHTTGTFGGVTGVYNRFRYLPEMRAALDLWARHLEVILASENVAGYEVPLLADA
jgi:integrase